MISSAYIKEWRQSAPWPRNDQVEQDLIISRALVEIFSNPVSAKSLAFRGGTALYKLHLATVRYSEDIDLVQVSPGPIGSLMDALQDKLNPWLGNTRYRLQPGQRRHGMDGYNKRNPQYRRRLHSGKSTNHIRHIR